MSIDVVEVVIWRESSVSGGSGAVQMFLRWQDRKSGSAGMPRPRSYAVFCLKKKTAVARERLLHEGVVRESRDLQGVLACAVGPRRHVGRGRGHVADDTL